MTHIEAMKQAKSLIEIDCKQSWKRVEVLEMLSQAIATEESSATQEPVAKPYAYEYGQDNSDGTYSVVINKGSLVQTQPAVYNYVRPQNAHKDWPIKELFDHPQPKAEQEPKREPLTDEQILTCARNGQHHHSDFRAGVRFAEAAHGIIKSYPEKDKS